MKPFILLLKIQLLGLFGINKTLHADPAKAKRTLALAALVVAAVVLFASAYSAGVAQGLVQIGLAEAVPLVAVLVGAIAGAVAAFLKTNGVLFGFKDYDLVMSLPVPTSSVVLSRIASLYAMSLLFGVLVMVPAFAVYASAAGVSAVGVACMALSIVLAPLLPLAAAVVLAVLIAAVSSRFKHANVAVIVLTLAATLAAVFGSFALSGQSDDLAALSALGAQLTGQLAAIFPPAAWATAGIVQGDLVQFAAFAAVNIAAAAAVFALVVRLFVPVNSLLMSSRPRGTFSFDGDKGAGAKSSTPFRALMVKELRLLAATPIYFMNACIGYVLVLVAAVAVAVGPGSFTGIRIGVSAAKGLAFSLDKPAAAVSTLAAMARNAAFAGGLILCAMDARRGQIYNAVFSAEGGVLTRLTPDRAISLAELAEELRPDARPKIAVGDGARLCADFLNQTGIPCQLAPPHLMMQNAMSVALEAEALALEGRLVDAQALLPVYLRPPQAERLRKAERR